MLAPGFLKAHPVHPAPGQLNGAVQSSSSLLPAVWLLRCALLCFFTFRLVLATFEAYFSPLDWLSDLIPNTFPEPFTFSTNSELYAHWACHDWGYMTKMPSLLSMDLGSKWGITNPTKEFPFLHIHSRQGWNCPSVSPGSLVCSLARTEPPLSFLLLERTHSQRQNLNSSSVLRWFCLLKGIIRILDPTSYLHSLLSD